MSFACGSQAGGLTGTMNPHDGLVPPPGGSRRVIAGDPVDVIAGLFASDGLQDYLGEAITQQAHLLQSGTLAERADAPAELIAGALLHDVGHFTGVISGQELMRGTDNRHGETGASWLARWLGPEVTEPVRLHVAAKRYLVAAEPAYAATLSPASVYTLGVQGGPMTRAEMASFEATPYAEAAIRVRRWDDAAKDPAATTPGFDHFRPVLTSLVR